MKLGTLMSLFFGSILEVEIDEWRRRRGVAEHFASAYSSGFASVAGAKERRLLQVWMFRVLASAP